MDQFVMGAMDPQPSCFVSGALATVLRMSRFAGTAPLRFERHGTGYRITLSSGWNVYGYFLVSTINLITTITLTYELLEQNIPRMQKSVQCALWAGKVILTLIFAGTVVYSGSGQMRSMITYLNEMQKIELELNIYRSMSKNRKETGLIVSWLIFNMLLALAQIYQLIFMRHHSETWVTALYSFFVCCRFIMLSRMMQLIIITLDVKRSFTAINNSLRSLLFVLADHSYISYKDKPINIKNKSKKFCNYVANSPDSRPTVTDGIVKSKNSFHETVRRLALVYTSVCDVMRAVDHNHGLIVLMILGYFVMNLTLTPYNLIVGSDMHSVQDALTFATRITMPLVWGLSHIMALVMFIEPCHLTHMEMETTRELVNHLMHCKHSIYEPLALELDVFYRYLVLNDVFFKPLKVLKVTRGLVITVLATITSYLVIFLQLGNRPLKDS